MRNHERGDIIRKAAWEAWLPIYAIADTALSDQLDRGLPTDVVRKFYEITDDLRVAHEALDALSQRIARLPDDPYEGVGEGSK